MPHLSVIALSINGGIKTLGAYAGLAAVVALALLALLYFAQARELKRLREWIEHEAQRPRAQAPVRAGAPVPAPPPAPAARLPISPVPLPGAVAPTQAPLVATSVEGVRRVSIADAAAAAGTEVVAPAAPAPASAPDATTVNEPDGLDEAPLPEPPAHPPRLVAGQVDGQEPGSVHEIGEGLVIGRGRGVSIRLTDPLVSGRHARVASDGGGVALEDLGSTNGTFLNGTQLSEPAVLSNGDRIRVGESEFVFESVPMPAPSPLADTTPPTDVPPASGASEPASDADGAALPTDDPSEPRGPSVAVPLLATPVPERTLDIDDADAIEAAPFSRSAMLPPPPAPPPAPHRDSPAITGAVPPPPAPITRVARGLPGDPDRPIESARRARRWRGGAALSGVGLA
ncbi:MAG TPA: FHA domain-containing protein, partial [Solirubrobacteraceae bacterium]|nr:FHA domain-containing protein [Solirubrobacteraceae bacterium]